MSNSSPNSLSQRSAFNKLVNDGVYDKDFQHTDHAKSFVTEVIQNNIIPNLTSKTARIIDCGCGTGAWLYWIHHLLSEKKINFQLFGFDLSDNMVETAQRNLAKHSIQGNLQQGDLLNNDSFKFEDIAPKFDFIFTYDTIQQLPKKNQYDACKLLMENLAPGGILVIFDHDAKSTYGRLMARKKFFTRYFGLRLVPRYYCNAKYPPLAEFSEKLIKDCNVLAEIVVAPDLKKRALIITSNYGKV